MLKTSGSTESKTQLVEGGVEVSDSSRAGRDGKKSGIDDIEVDGKKIRDDEIGKKVQKCKNLSKSQKAVRSDFLTPEARLAFIKLGQAFVKAPILY